jgi:hypothetical protein
MRARSVKHRFRFFDQLGLLRVGLTRLMPINESFSTYEVLTIVMALIEPTVPAAVSARCCTRSGQRQTAR